MRLQSPQALTFDESLTIVSQIGRALEHAHQHSIVHRDLKPSNILFNQRGEALLADCGIATLLSAASTRYTNPVGTPAYMAPEQFRGQVSKATDQYALGCVAYELFTGRKPFTAPDFVAFAFQHIKEEPIPPAQHHPEIPRHVELAILKAMSKQREDRHRDIAAFIVALQASPGTVPLTMPLPPDISTVPSSNASTSLQALEAQRETELFEKDFLFEEYIVKRVRQKSLPPAWRVYQPPCRWMIRRAIIASLVVGIPGLLIAFVLAVQEAFYPTLLPYITWLPFLIIVAVLAILVSGLIYGILRLYCMRKNQVLVITPNGCMYLEWGVPVSMIRYSTVTWLRYSTEDQELSARTNLLSIEMSLARFGTPEIIAQYIDEAYTCFKERNRRSGW